MAAYAALVSLMNLLEQIQHHPRPPITLDTNQVQTLTQKIDRLQNFLEIYNSHYSKQEVEHLRNRIADVAYSAEDLIETHIVNRIHARSTSYESYDEEESILSTQDLSVEVDDLQGPSADASPIYDEENICSIDLNEVIRDMGFVVKEVLEIKDTLRTQDPQRSVATDVVAPKSTSTEHNTMVVFDDVVTETLDKLTGQPDSPCRIIPIFGMGGIGKTTLARNVYIHPLTDYYFDVRAWITISQEYNTRDMLLGVLLSQKDQGSRESMSQMSDAMIGDRLYRSLYGRRYLIVMDDMWSLKAWDGVRRFFPNDFNGSRIIVTTRITDVASNLTNHGGVEMEFLDEDKSWSLFCRTVFGEEDTCPPELERVGKEISKNCKGLPLSIVVLGGLLAKSRTQDYWESIAENLNSVVNLEENERYSKILRTSYDELPAHLKACFLYMAVFPEDHEIRASELIEMWVAESFLKPINGKGLEKSAEECLMDLVGRNLIMVHENELFRQEKICNIHDVLRDLCIREARKEKFICVANQHGEGINTQRRVAIHQGTSKKECRDSLKGGLTTRSLICFSRDSLPLPLAELRLLRVFTRIDAIYEKDKGNYRLEDICRLVNLRYVSLGYDCRNLIFPSFLAQLWNLQKLHVHKPYVVFAPREIWKMPLIRHIQSEGLILPDPPSGHTDGRDGFVLHELHTLAGVTNLKLGEEMIKRIANVNKLELNFDYRYEKPLDLGNLHRLDKLEDFSIMFEPLHPPSRTELMQNLTFPPSLKKLALSGTKLHWKDISAKLGSLPHLQMLILGSRSITGPEWKTVEGDFCSLKYLQIDDCVNLKWWITESTHFPCLECLHLVNLRNLQEISLWIGDIATLKSIIVRGCSDSAVISANRILQVQKEEFGNESIRARIQLETWNDKSLKRLATPNFQFEAGY